MTSDVQPRFSVVITTRNRGDDLLVAIESVLAQEGTAVEVLVYDDASDDCSPDRVEQVFPEVRLFRHTQRTGYIVHRNAGYRDARGEFVVSIDDDAYFTDRQTLARVAELFDHHAEAGAFALPYVEPHRDWGSGKMPAQPVAAQLRSYVGCAHAVRRELFLPLGGYRELLVHQGEERDFCIRLLDAGHSVLYADTSPIVHTVNPSRSRSRMAYYGFRNTLLFSALNAPQPFVIPRMLANCGQLMVYRFRLSDVPLRLWSLAAGFGASWKYYSSRKPVSRATWRQFRSLPGHGPLAGDDSQSIPPPVCRSMSCDDTSISKTA